MLNTFEINNRALSCLLVTEDNEEEGEEDQEEECEEIDATQVIIHDSTPQTPVIQRRNRRVYVLVTLLCCPAINVNGVVIQSNDLWNRIAINNR